MENTPSTKKQSSPLFTELKDKILNLKRYPIMDDWDCGYNSAIDTVAGAIARVIVEESSES